MYQMIWSKRAADVNHIEVVESSYVSKRKPHNQKYSIFGETYFGIQEGRRNNAPYSTEILERA